MVVRPARSWVFQHIYANNNYSEVVQDQVNRPTGPAAL